MRDDRNGAPVLVRTSTSRRKGTARGAYAWVPAFLDALKKGLTAGEAADIAGVARITPHVTRLRHPEFRAAWIWAKDHAKVPNVRGNLPRYNQQAT